MASEIISGYIARLPDDASGSLRRVGSARVAGRFLDCELTSVFQPVLAPDGAVLAHTALVRCYDAAHLQQLGPCELFALARSDSDLVRLDRLCRTVHAINYFASVPPGRPLILKVDPRLLSSVPDQHGRAFERVLASLGVAPSEVVIEIPAAANANPALVAHVVANYRFRGFRVAVHHEGDAGWLATLAHLRADFIQVRFRDSAMVSLRAAVAVAHECGARSLVTHLETGTAVDAAREAGADLLQGFELARPSA